MTKTEENQEHKLLATEIEAFQRLQPELKRTNPGGGFAVIKGGEVVGVWRDEMDALNEGAKKFKEDVFLVRDINDTGEPVYFSRDIFASSC